MCVARVAVAEAATEPGYTLEWQTDGACPDGDFTRGAIDELLAEATPREGPPVAARGRIEATRGGHRLVLEVGDGGQRREIEGTDCVELARVAALIVAMAVDPRVLSRIDLRVPPPPPEPPPADPIPPPEPAIATEPAIASEPEAPPLVDEVVTPPTSPPRPDAPTVVRPIGVAGSLMAALDLGTLPAATALVGVSLAGFGRRWRAELLGQYATPRRISSTSAARVGMQAQAWSVGGRGCFLWRRARASFGACGTVRGGLVHARGRGDLEAVSARQRWIGAGPGGLVIVPVGRRLGLLAGLDVLAAVARGGFRTEPSGRVAAPWPVAPAAWVGIQWRSLTGPQGGGQPRR